MDTIEFQERAKAFDKEEKAIVVKFIPDDILVAEVARRLANGSELFKAANALLTASKEEMQYAE